MTTRRTRLVGILIISVLVHFFIAAALWRLGESEKNSEIQTEIHLRTQETLPQARSRPANARAVREKIPSQRKSQPTVSERLIGENRVGPPSPRQGQLFTDSSTSDWGSQSGDPTIWESTLFYKTIYEKIESGLFYPTVLARHGIKGHIQARLVFDPVVGCVWKKASISEGNPHLRVFVLDRLRRACHDETVHRLRPLRTVTADLSFEFIIGEPAAQRSADDDRRKHGPRMVGNVLLFETHFAKSALTWELGPFTGTFPLPFVNVNFQWLQENWDRVVNGKTSDLPEVKEAM